MAPFRSQRFPYRLPALLIAIAISAALCRPAVALTAGDVVNKMTPEQSTGWMFGAAEMAVRLFLRMGDTQRSACIQDWISAPGAAGEMDAAMRANVDQPAAAVVEAVMLRKCGEYK